MPLNIVLFGEAGVGKSSVINLIADKDVANTPRDAWRCTLESKQYTFEVGGRTFTIWETIGLGEPLFSTPADYLGAIEKTYTLIQQIAAQGGLDLLLFCVRNGSRIPTMLCNYNLFFDVLCERKIPIALVVTHPESDTSTDDRWDQNMHHFNHWGLQFSNHTCVTAVPGHPETAEPSRAALVDLLLHCDPERRCPMPSPSGWFSGFLERLPIIPCPQKLKNKPSQLEQVLRDRCGVDSADAGRLATKNLCQSMRDLFPLTEGYRSECRSSFNIVLFGEAGVGKSSVINLIAKTKVAETSPDASACTMESKQHTFKVAGRTFNIWDTVGLGEPSIGTAEDCFSAIVKTYELIQQIEAEGGLDLLLFCMPGCRVTGAMQCNYRLFFEALCDKQIPISAVVTRLEGESKLMEEWWVRSKEVISKSGLIFSGHACVTGLERHRKAVEGRSALELLLLNFNDKGRYPMPPASDWFSDFLKRVFKVIPRPKSLKAKQNELEQLLCTRCQMDSASAKRLAESLTRSRKYPNPTTQSLLVVDLPGSNSTEPTVPFPDIIRWFSFLDQRVRRDHPHVTVNFAAFGPVLQAKGFLDISQLSREYVSLPNLQEWLGVEIGTAILISQRVEADLRAVAGKHILPTDS